MATANTVHCVVTKLVPCFSNNQQHVLRTVLTPHVRLGRVSPGEHHNRGKGFVPAAHWHISTPGLHCEGTRRCWGIFGHAQRNQIQRTTWDPRPAIISSCNCEDWHEPSRLAASERQVNTCLALIVRVTFNHVRCVWSVRQVNAIFLLHRWEDGTLRHLADWLATTGGPLSLGPTIHELARLGYVSSTVANSMFLNVAL